MLKYALLTVIILAIGYMEIQTLFAPAGTFLALLSLSSLWLYRTIIQRIFPAVASVGPFVFYGVLLCITNVAIGASLNGLVEDSALGVISSVNAYKKLHGEFPESISKVSLKEALSDSSKGRLRYGSRFFYIKSNNTFHFGYRTYPWGTKIWNENANAFESSVN